MWYIEIITNQQISTQIWKEATPEGKYDGYDMSQILRTLKGVSLEKGAIEGIDGIYERT